MFFPSFQLLRKNTQTREVPTAEGLLPFSRLLFLSFPFGIHVSTDGMADTDNGWRSLLSEFVLSFQLPQLT